MSGEARDSAETVGATIVVPVVRPGAPAPLPSQVASSPPPDDFVFAYVDLAPPQDADIPHLPIAPRLPAGPRLPIAPRRPGAPPRPGAPRRLGANRRRPESLPPAPPSPPSARRSRRWIGGVAVLAVVAVLALVAVVTGAGSTAAAPATGAAAIVPGDALAYVNVSLDRGRSAVTRALSVAARFPQFPLAADLVLARLAAILGGGAAIDFDRQVTPWLGDEGALAVLNTPSTTAGSLIVLAVSDSRRALAFLRSVGATPAAARRGIAVWDDRAGTDVAFLGGFLVAGQPASVDAAIDTDRGAVSSLSANPAYRRAAASEPAGRVVDGFISPAGVRRILQPRRGALGGLGDLLYQPALDGIAFSLSPAAVGGAGVGSGVRITIHADLDPSLTALDGPARVAFVPTLPAVIPASSTLVYDVHGLTQSAPGILTAAASAGLEGRIGPLLRRLGAALRAEGGDVAGLEALFDGETAVAITTAGGSSALVIAARVADPAEVQFELADLEAPFAQLFAPSRKALAPAPAFTTPVVDGVTAHQLVVAGGLQVDYAVLHGLVVISTNLHGIAAMADPGPTLAHDPSYAATLDAAHAAGPGAVTSLVFARPAPLWSLLRTLGFTAAATYGSDAPPLSHVTALGLRATRAGTDITLQIRS